MSTPVTILIDAASYAAWLFLISVGLTLVFGVLRLLNIAHGAFYSVGAYLAAYAIGFCTTHGWTTSWQFAAAAAAALAGGAGLGFVIERTVIQRLNRRPPALVMIATYAVFLILEDLTKLVWGGQPIYANQPRDALGQVQLGGLAYPVYDIALIVVSLGVALGIWSVLHFTRIGRCVMAVVADREIGAAMGINVQRIMCNTFILGAVLGTFAGAMTAPKIAIGPGIGFEVIVLAFAVVVVGGLGSIPGSLAGAGIIGLARSLTVHLAPELELFSVYAVMAVVLAVRPYGLFAPTEARKV